MNRRDFLQLSGALALAPRFAAAQDVFRLKAAPALQHMVGAGNPPTQVWAYNGTVPGPLLRYRQGERLRIEVHNAIDFDTTVHWHGIRLPNAMDGVPHLTQAPIRKGGRFLYEFDLPDAGTFWYHPHLGSAEQVGRGLAGALIVEEREPPKVDRDLVWVLSDWRLNEVARISPDFLHPRDSSHNGRIGNTVTVNGTLQESFAVRSGERIRLRLINASNARIYALRFEGHAPWVIALDGHPVEPQRTGERIVLGPAQRADLILDCGGAPGSRHRVIDDFYPRVAYRLLDLAYSDEEPLLRTQEIPSRLAANPVAVPDLAKAQRHRIVFGGGAMGAVPDQRQHRGLFWTVNGTPIPEHTHSAPLLSFKRNFSYLLELVNDTAWHHPIHLHGHTFRVLTKNGKPADEWGDTVLIDPRSRAEVAFVADNPGDWMLHCHVLEHQASGMMATVRVA